MRRLAMLLPVAILAGCGGPVPEEEIGPPRMDVAIAPSGEERQSERSSTLEWELPAEWQEERPSSNMRLMQASTADGVDIVIFFFGEGQGGDVESNFARWRGQIAAEGEIGEEAFETDGLRVSLMDASGTLQPSPMAGIATARPGSRLVAAVIEGPGGPWFFRATGPEEAVANRAGEIRAFLRSLE